jgi:hypothetical protein
LIFSFFQVKNEDWRKDLIKKRRKGVYRFVFALHCRHQAWPCFILFFVLYFLSGFFLLSFVVWFVVGEKMKVMCSEKKGDEIGCCYMKKGE